MRREIPKFDGIYLPGKLQNLDINFTLDTGATRTLISIETYEKLPESYKPTLTALKNPRVVNCTANGGIIECLGHAVFNFTLGSEMFDHRATVAEIDDEVILGTDILYSDEYGPADLILSTNILLFRGHPLKIRVVGMKHKCCRVMAADTYVISGMSEVIIDSFLENPAGPPPTNCSCMILEPSYEFLDKQGCMLAPCIVDPSMGLPCKVRIMNPNCNDTTVHKNQLVGYAEEIDSELCTLLDCENERKISTCTPVRRIPLSEYDGPNTISTSNTQGNLPEHLKPLMDNVNIQNNDDEHALVNLLLANQNVFSTNDQDLGLCTLTEHVIETGDAKPIKQPPRRVPLAFADEDRKALNELTKQGSIRPSTSPWASPIVLVRKKNGQVRPCVDYRKLNAVTKKDAFPLPRIQDCLDSIDGANLFSTLDITSAYNQIPVRKEDIPKTAFVTKYGLFEYTTMPFGLCNAPATFQRVIELALSGLQWVSCLILYLDDIIVFSHTMSENIEKLAGVFECLRKAGLKLKPEKCKLLRTEVTFLGHLISDKGIQPDPSNVEKVTSWPTPTNLTQVRGIIALGSYYRRFVKDFSKVVKPMTQLTEKGRPFLWTDECETSFQNLKKSLTSPPIMSFPKDGGSFILDTDACDISIGAVLSQVQNGATHVISYGSRTLNKAEKNYCVTDKELLSVKFFCEYYRQYLLGYPFLIRTDHQALKWLFSLREPKNRIARWIEILSQFDFTIDHRPGKQHSNADSLSRCPMIQRCECPGDNLKCGPCSKCSKRSIDMKSSYLSDPSPTRRILPFTSAYQIPTSFWHLLGTLMMLMFMCIMTWHQKFKTFISSVVKPNIIRKVSTRGKITWSLPCTMNGVHKQQLSDPSIGPVMYWLKSGIRPQGPEVQKSSPETRHYWNLWDSLRLKGEVLCREFTKKNGSGNYWQIIVPASMRPTILHQMHNNIISGHLGVKKTREKTLQKFYWFGIRDEIYNWVHQCEECGQNKKPSTTPPAPLGKMPTGAPLDRLATDFLGPFPETPRGNKHILVVTDTFTKWVEIFATPDQSAKTTASILLNEVIARFGCPYDLLSDQGKNFESKIFTELCRLLEIRKLRTSAANPQCNGQAERFNRTLLTMIKCYLSGQETSWDMNLGCLAAAYRMTPNESTGLTPNLLMLGREVRHPVEIISGSRGPDGTDVTNYHEYVASLCERFQTAHEIARVHLTKRASRQKQDYDGKSTLKSYFPGDFVWYASEFKQLHITPKLRSPYSGPYLVLKRMTDLDYLIQLDAKGSKKLVHHNKLKSYTGNCVPKWGRTALNTFNKTH